MDKVSFLSVVKASKVCSVYRSNLYTEGSKKSMDVYPVKVFEYVAVPGQRGASGQVETGARTSAFPNTQDYTDHV